MAGAYPDAPSRRMAYDVDGTVIIIRNITLGVAWTQLSAPQRTDLNNESQANTTILGGGGADHFHLAFIFPELREFDGWFAAWANTGGTGPSPLETSNNTTNGIDGTWVTRIAEQHPYENQVYNAGRYRTGITSLAVTGVRGVRSESRNGNNGWYRAAHVYGDITPGETPDRLLFIDETTGLEFTAPKDYGNIPRGSSEDFELRLKNNSASLSASTIQYTGQALYLASGGWYTFTLPGGSTFQASRQIASLAATATTGIITTRRITPGTETVGPHAGRILATVGTWS